MPMEKVMTYELTDMASPPTPAARRRRRRGQSAVLQALSQRRPSFTRRRPHASTRPAGVFSLRSTNDGSRRRPPPVGPSPSSQARSTLLEVARRQRRKQRQRNQEPSSVRLRCVARLLILILDLCNFSWYSGRFHA